MNFQQNISEVTPDDILAYWRVVPIGGSRTVSDMQGYQAVLRHKNRKSFTQFQKRMKLKVYIYALHHYNTINHTHLKILPTIPKEWCMDEYDKMRVNHVMNFIKPHIREIIVIGDGLEPFPHDIPEERKGGTIEDQIIGTFNREERQLYDNFTTKQKKAVMRLILEYHWSRGRAFDQIRDYGWHAMLNNTPGEFMLTRREMQERVNTGNSFSFN